MYIDCCKSGTKLSWHADICVIVHKLAPRPSFGTMWRLIEKVFHIAVVVSLYTILPVDCGKYVMNCLHCRFSSLMSRDTQLRRSSVDACLPYKFNR